MASVPSPALQISAGIRRLEGHIDGETLVFAPQSVFAGDLKLVRVDALSRFWNNSSLGFGTLESRHEKLLAGLCNDSVPWAYIVLGNAKGIAVYLALPSSKSGIDTWGSTLSAAFPGCELSPGPSVDCLINALNQLPWGAAMTGNPSLSTARPRPNTEKPTPHATLESVFRTMQGGNWAYLVMARPVSQSEIQQTLAALGQEERELCSAYLRRGSAEENNNPRAKHYLTLLQAARKNHETGTRQGMWKVHAVLLAADRDRMSLGAQALMSAFAAPDNRPQPIRVRPCLPRGEASSRELPSTCLTTPEAAALARLPAEEFAGYLLRDFVQFAVSPPVVQQPQRLSVGLVLDRGRRTGNWFELGVDDLCKHVLVAGVPGSGKTQTCQYLLRQLWEENQIPWLVLEPSMKSEYRLLLAGPASRDLRIFTLGDETGVPFRFNPLEVQPGVHIQTHIDGLVALFNAAFALVTPMPYVLSLALHRVYEERGWDLTRGNHPRGDVPEAQPVLSDLSRTIQHLVRELGYDAEITGNIRAGLLTRLMSLTTGSKGTMLDSRASIPMDYLLSGPAVLEFAAMGSDEDKAFVLGAILLRLIEFRQAAGLSGNSLRHVTLIEEAHRLLTAAPQNLPSEEANPRGKAVETFCNLLAEVRAYGEGIIVADQVPTKLAPDILKNTNLKIAHRLVADDERRKVGGCMNLSEAQERYLSTLRCGIAAVYAEGCEAAYLVSIPDHARQYRGQAFPGKESLIKHMQGKVPAIEADPHPYSHVDALPPPGCALPKCPGCEAGDCSSRSRVADHLLRVDHAEEFAEALKAGWEGLWAFGKTCAAQIWDDGQLPREAPYCVVMNIAALAGYDDETCDKIRRNLNVFVRRAREK